MEKWIGVGLLILGAVVGAQYVRAAVRHQPPTTATIAPEALTPAAATLPVTEVESYF